MASRLVVDQQQRATGGWQMIQAIEQRTEFLSAPVPQRPRSLRVGRPDRLANPVAKQRAVPLPIGNGNCRPAGRPRVVNREKADAFQPIGRQRNSERISFKGEPCRAWLLVIIVIDVLIIWTSSSVIHMKSPKTCTLRRCPSPKRQSFHMSCATSSGDYCCSCSSSHGDDFKVAQSCAILHPLRRVVEILLWRYRGEILSGAWTLWGDARQRTSVSSAVHRSAAFWPPARLLRRLEMASAEVECD
jgi:hypothetical protein